MKVSEHVGPQLQSLLGELRDVLARLSTPDDEAIHDLRVALRRLRSLLRPLRDVYDADSVVEARDALKAIGDASSELRDEEVLGELLGDLDVPKATKTATSRWLTTRATTTARLRTTFVRSLTEGALQQAVDLVDAVISIPPKAKRDVDVVVFAHKVVWRAQRDIEKTLRAGKGDVEGLHELRIDYKRLRYAIDGLESALAPELVSMRDVATRLQKRLGDLHDIDVAKVIVGAARTLSAMHRTRLLVALEECRDHAIAKFHADAGPRGAALTVGPAPASLPALLASGGA